MSAQRTLDEFDTESTDDTGSTERVRERTGRPLCESTNADDEPCQEQSVLSLPVCTNHLVDYHDLAEQIEDLLTDATRCTYCGTVVREAHPEYDDLEARRLSVGDTTLAFEAAGHEIADDGTVDANHRLRPTHVADVDDTPDGRVLFCGECGRRPDDSTDGCRPTETLQGIARRLLAEFDGDADPDVVADEVDRANGAGVDDGHVLATALLRAL